MDFRYDNPNDANQQLDGCVMKTEDGRVVHLSYAGGWDYDVRDIINYDSNVLDIREVGLSFEPIELGYINGEYSLCYVVRNPIRMWKAGLSWDNLTAIYGNMEDGVFGEPPMARCILRDYPTLQVAQERASFNGHNVAFHPDFALTTHSYPRVDLAYKGKVIGILNDNLNFEVEEKFVYVREILEEIINGKG